jgi:hypothetical protein
MLHFFPSKIHMWEQTWFMSVIPATQEAALLPEDGPSKRSYMKNKLKQKG